MNDYIKTVIQAIIQGLTEFLPVSSSGHLSVAQHFMGAGGESLSMSVFLHMGTLLAVLVSFREAVFGIIREFFLTVADAFTGKFSWREMNGDRRMMFMVIIGTLPLFPAVFFKDYLTAPAADGDIIFEGCAFIFTAMVLFMADSCVKGVKKPENMKIKDAVTVGVFQCIALFPGVSRSGSTISSGLFCGLSRKTAVTFSFMLGIPAILGASLLEMKEIAGGESAAEGYNPVSMGIGFVIAAIVGIFAIKFVKMLIKKEKFKIFAVYTLTLGIACVGWGVFETVTGISVKL
ncbi:MAG: undecaprenyl-diphosphate phosphatase [Oscillospiraceae bacterium]|jgi:undecaprenyl-diphosphatase|nr:undecaprenyl-diphosphate phosphatase [Oscillospiraceae bacterium]